MLLLQGSVPACAGSDNGHTVFYLGGSVGRLDGHELVLCCCRYAFGKSTENSLPPCICTVTITVLLWHWQQADRLLPAPHDATLQHSAMDSRACSSLTCAARALLAVRFLPASERFVVPQWAWICASFLSIVLGAIMFGSLAYYARHRRLLWTGLPAQDHHLIASDSQRFHKERLALLPKVQHK